MFIKKFFCFFILFLLFGGLIAPFFSLAKEIANDCAQYCGDMATYTMPVGTACVCSRNNPEGNEEGIIDRATNWIFYFGLILAPLFILIGAFKFFTAGGDFKKASSATKIIVWSVIGLTLALCTRLIYHVIRFLIGQ